MDEYYNFLIQSSDRRINLKDIIDLLLDFNKEPNQKMGE